jgi:hypothetical protein
MYYSKEAIKFQPPRFPAPVNLESSLPLYVLQSAEKTKQIIEAHVQKTVMHMLLYVP